MFSYRRILEEPRPVSYEYIDPATGTGFPFQQGVTLLRCPLPFFLEQEESFSFSLGHPLLAKIDLDVLDCRSICLLKTLLLVIIVVFWVVSRFWVLTSRWRLAPAKLI